MTLNELEIIERTAQARCGKRYVISLDPLKDSGKGKMILLRVEDRLDSNAVYPVVLEADSTLKEVCEVAIMLTQDVEDTQVSGI